MTRSLNQTITVAVFGANGRVGSLIVAQALNRGCRVIAFVHGESRLPHYADIKVFRGDVRNRADVHRALRKADVVISALGSWGTKSQDILSSGMRTIVPVMEDLGLKRIVTLTGADASAAGDRPGIMNKLSRFLIGIIGGKVITDAEAHIRILQGSSLDWVIVRSPVMTGGTARPYRLTPTLAPPYATIRRTSVAEAMLDLALHPRPNKSLVTIRRSKS